MTRCERTRSVVSVLALVALTAVPAAASAAEEVVEHTLAFEPGDRLALENTNGHVEVSSWDRDEVEVRAVKRARGLFSSRDDLDEVTVDVRREGDTVRVETRRPKRSSGILSWMLGGDSISVSYEIRLPSMADLEIETVNGAILVEGVVGRHDVSSTNGRITLERAGGALVASTTNGGIHAELTSLEGHERVRLTTTNGSVHLALPADIAAALDVRTTNGSIRTDFPVRMSGRASRRSLSGEINGGGAEIEIKTTNGSVRVVEL